METLPSCVRWWKCSLIDVTSCTVNTMKVELVSSVYECWGVSFWWLGCARKCSATIHTHTSSNSHIYTNTSTCNYTESIWCHWLVSSGLAPVRAWQVWAAIRNPAVFLCQQGVLSASQDSGTHKYSHWYTNMCRRGEELDFPPVCVRFFLNLIRIGVRKY